MKTLFISIFLLSTINCGPNLLPKERPDAGIECVPDPAKGHYCEEFVECDPDLPEWCGVDAGN